MLRNSWLLAMMSMALTAEVALAGTLGKVVPIGGEASDIALDEARGVLYVANFTASRIDVMSLSSKVVQTSMNVPSQPSSISLSPDGHWLLVAHYGNNTAPASPTNALTLIDLTAGNAKQTFALGNPPLGVAFGLDNKAVVVTTQEFMIFDPAVGTTQLLQTIAQVATNALPQPPASFPGNIVQATVTTSRDGLTIAGFGGTSPYILFRYNVATHGITSSFYVSSPPAGPRTISLSNDGSLQSLAWFVQDATFNTTAEFANPSGVLNVGTSLIDSSRNLIYAQMPPATTGASATASAPTPILQILDSDNLTLRDQIQLPENLAGKSLLSSDNNTMYSVSDSGVMVLPVGQLSSYPRLVVSTEDVVFRGNFCNRNVSRQTLTITDPGGGQTPFSISTTTSGITISPSSGVTPATVTVSVDPNAFASQKGTVTATLNITSSVAVNLAPSVRVLINSQDPAQRGTFLNVPGKVVDLLADPKRNVYYVLRQDKNQVLVYSGSNNTQTATLRTCTTPKGMAITFDQQYLLIGCDKSHYMSVYDLDLLQAQPPIAFPQDYVQSVAASASGILAHLRSGTGAAPGIGVIDMIARTGTRLPALGVYQNKLALDTVLSASGNGAHILIASSDGSVMIYDANANSFTVSRKDFTALGGAYAASSFNQYIVGNNVLDASGVPIGTLPMSTGSSSGFAFVNQGGYFTTAPNATSAGVIAQVDLSTGSLIKPTPIVEAPLLGSMTSGSVWTRSIAPLPNQTAIINLTTSGFTVLPWTYSAAVAPPQITKVASAADNSSPAAPGGLITVTGTQLSPTNLATSQIPLPTALANSCLTVNGQPMPIIFVTPMQINAQMPFQAVGAVTMVVHTPGGTSDDFNLTVPPNSPAVFLSGVAGPQVDLPTVIRQSNNLLATDSNPIHRNDSLVIYLTGLGVTNPQVGDGLPAPGNPLASALAVPVVQLGGMTLPVDFAGLAPGEVGVNQINVSIPANTPTGLSIPLTITQGGVSLTISMRVVD